MTKPVNIAALEKATGMTWQAWLNFFESIHAQDLSHTQIAKQAYTKLQHMENGGWWSQGATVAYEQHIGRRQPGQRSDGTFEISVNKTMACTKAQAIEAWQNLIKDRTEFNGVLITKPPTTSQTERNHHWGCNLTDGTRVNIDAYQKAPGKIGFTLTHIKIASPIAAQQWRTYWQAVLADIT